MSEEDMKKLRDWYWPLFHPIVNIIDENGKRIGIDLEDVKLDLEYVEP